MNYKEHCKECEEKLGKQWNVVHRWLDELAKIYWPWMGHRVHRHHIEGVEEVRKKWGDEAAEAAKLHIRADFNGHLPSKKEVEIMFGVNDEENAKRKKGYGH